MASHTLSGLSLRDLEYAVAVADLRHFGRAAERCGVSQAGLSEQVRKLEAVLGVVLFERTPRGSPATRQGEALLAQARVVLGSARVLLEMARVRDEPLAGPLRLGAIATLGPYYLPRVLHAVRGRFPRLELRLQEDRTDPLLAALGAGELDAVLLALPAGIEAVAAEPLFFEPFRAVLPAGHKLAEREALRVRDLAGAGLLLLEEGHCLRDHALSLCGAREAGPSDRFATSLEMLRHMVAAGEGHSLLPLLALDARSDLDGLVLVRELVGADAGRTVGLAWRSTDPRGAAFQDLAAVLRAARPAGTLTAPSKGS